MLSRSRTLFLAAAICSLAFVGKAQAEEMDNPLFHSWTQFKVGTSSTLKADMNMGSMTMTQVMKSTLKDIAADHVDVQVEGSINVMGQDHPFPSRTNHISSKTEKKNFTQIGEEDVEAAGHTYHCKVFDGMTATAKNPNTKAKIWMSADVPGGMVKMETESKSPQGQPITLKFLLTAVDIK